MEKITINQLAENCAKALAKSLHTAISADFCTGYDENYAGWHGIKTIKTGFDSDEILLVADYYGGGAMVTGKIDPQMAQDDIKNVIQTMIIGTLDYMEDGINGDTLLATE